MAAIKDLIRIAVADDDLSVLQLFCNHINTLEKCKVVLQAGNGAELLKTLKEKPDVDLVILDIMMPVMGGYETANIIRQQYPDMRILFYSVAKSELALQLMARYGGHGLIQKGVGADEARKAIKSVMKNKYYFPALAEDIEINRNLNGKVNGNSLKDISDNEMIFMRLCASEMTYKEVADKMNMEKRQLEHLRETVFRKMEVKCRVGLVLRAMESGLVIMHPCKEIPEYLA